MKDAGLILVKTMPKMAVTGVKMTEMSGLLHESNCRAMKCISLGCEIKWLGQVRGEQDQSYFKSDFAFAHFD